MTEPVILPVAESSESPLGKPSAVKVIGRDPVAGIAKKNGDPGRTPNTDGPLIRGVAGADGVNGGGNAVDSGDAEASGEGVTARARLPIARNRRLRIDFIGRRSV